MPHIRTRYQTVLTLAVALSAGFANAALVNKYNFNEGNINDSVGGQNGTLVDPSGIAFYSNGQVQLTANNGANSNQDFTNPSTVGAYIDLPNGLISSAANGGDFYEFSIEMWATVQENRNWARLADFGVSNQGENMSGSADATDYLILVPQTDVIQDPVTEIDGNYFAAATHSQTGFEDRVVDSNGPLSVGVEHHIVVTVDQFDTTGGANGTLSLYLDNTLISSGPVEDDGNVDFTFFNDVNNWLGRAQWGDPLFDGSYNEFRVYDHALTAAEVSSSNAIGPDAGGIAVPTLVVNRDTGEITVLNDEVEQLRILGYSIASDSGSLDPSAWSSIDAGNFDPNGTWTASSTTAELIAEATTGDGGAIEAGLSESIGMAWNPSPFEDITFNFTLSSGDSATGQVVFTGNGDQPIAASDLDGNGILDADDFTLFAAGSQTDLTGMSAYELYKNGDLDGDGDNDYYDFRLFKAEYIAANGVAAFAALNASLVPEPTTALLLMIGLSPAVLRASRRS